LQGAGVHATLKHFVGYSASQAGRNLAPVHAGPREVADVLLIPFEMAVLDGGVRSVMHTYAEIDGLPVACDPRLLTDLLRGRWGFDGTVVADYFGVAFLHTLHGVAADLGDAAAQALTAGVDVELPTGNAYLAPLLDQVRAGVVDECVDRPTPRRRHRARCEAVGAGIAVLGMAGESCDGAAVASGLLKVTAMQVSEGAGMAVMNREFSRLRGSSHAAGEVAPCLGASPQTTAAVSCA
jgi:hypothetical protein